jgi:hypothetical protein
VYGLVLVSVALLAAVGIRVSAHERSVAVASRGAEA